MENLRFEESFKDAFDGAEIAPSSVVWTNVELGLEKTSGGKMRGRLLFFQLLAAASMVFAMGIGSVYFLNTTQETAQPTAQRESTNALQNQNEKAAEKSTTENKTKHQENKSTLENRSKLKSTNVGVTTEADYLMSSVPSEIQTNNESEVSLISGKRTLPRLVEVGKPSLKIATNEPDPGMVLLAKLRDEEKKYQQHKPKLKEKLWASLGMGAGKYNPNTSGSIGNGLSSMSSQDVSSSDPSSGTSYSVGVSVGGKVSKRVVLQGGISYLSQNSNYTSSIASVNGEASLNEYATASIMGDDAVSRNQLRAASPYQVNNNLQYVSVPLQAGYIIVDRALALQVNGGISTDVFFRNTLTPENSDLNEFSQGAGSDSPYRTLNFSGLLGTELSYKVGEHYRIAVNPGMRYALNSIYKSEVAGEVSPITFDVALRVRYLF